MLSVNNVGNNFTDYPWECWISALVWAYSLIFLIKSILNHKTETFNKIAFVFTAIMTILFLLPESPSQVDGLKLGILILYGLGLIAIPTVGSTARILSSVEK
jgi:hypothetical protein